MDDTQSTIVRATLAFQKVMKKWFLATLSCLSWHLSFSQDDAKFLNQADATVAAGNYQGSFSLSYLHDWKLGTRRKLGLGIGGRFTSYFGQNQYYVTAPAKLTSGSTGPGAIFQDDIEKNIDTLLVQSPQVNSLNLFINIDYSFSSKFVVGFNIDAIGFSFGGNRQGNYINGSSGKITDAAPTPFNVLLVSDNDRGSLNSEFYGKYSINNKWGLKAGVQFLFTEYTTTTKVQTYPEENDRFRNKSLLFCLGITYKL